jgi:hypothetical protein
MIHLMGKRIFIGQQKPLLIALLVAAKVHILSKEVTK